MTLQQLSFEIGRTSHSLKLKLPGSFFHFQALCVHLETRMSRGETVVATAATVAKPPKGNGERDRCRKPGQMHGGYKRVTVKMCSKFFNDL